MDMSYSQCHKLFPLREACKSPLTPLEKRGELQEINVKVPL